MNGEIRGMSHQLTPAIIGNWAAGLNDGRHLKTRAAQGGGSGVNFLCLHFDYRLKLSFLTMAFFHDIKSPCTM